MLIYDQIVWLQKTKKEDPITFWYILTIAFGSTLFSLEAYTSDITNINFLIYTPVVIGCIIYLIYDVTYKQNSKN